MLNGRARILTVALTAALLTACGFHLRGDIDFNAARFHLTGGDIELADALTDALTRRGAGVTDAAKNATVITLQSRFNRATLTTDARGRANAHEIRYEVDFSIADGEQPTTHTITVTRVLNYDSSRQLQSELETQFLESAMRADAAARIMQVLSRR